MDQRAREIIKQGDKLFSKRSPLNNLWQELALNFYPERADFTGDRTEGEEFSDHLFTSYPALARRELGNVLSSYLYSRSQKRFSIHIDDETVDNGHEERQYLEYLTSIQWRAMYDTTARLSRAIKQSAHDFVTFGNNVIKFGMNINGDALLFNNYHLRDNAWTENAEGKVDCNHRNWCPTARQIAHYFPKTMSEAVKRALIKDPEKIFDCRHVIMPSRLYDGDSKGRNNRKFGFTSFYVEKESETVLEETGLNYFCYVIPRWHTVAGSQYGISMATSIILPDGRTMQVVTRTLREAGEKYTDPPMVAVTEAIRGDVHLHAGGITSADAEYDSKIGDVLRPISQDKGGMPIGIEIAAALKEDIRAGFFLDKIQLPDVGKDMTAFEVRRRVEEHIRAQTPIFDPIEEEFAPLYEGVYQLMSEQGAFPVQEMPESLMGRDIHFSFFSPLADLADQREAETYIDVMTRILIPASQIDPAQMANANLTESTRSAMRAAGWKATWFNPKEEVAVQQKQHQQQAMMAKGVEAIGALGGVAEQGGKGMSAIKEAMAAPEQGEIEP
jgi:hypothetical protein